MGKPSNFQVTIPANLKNAAKVEALRRGLTLGELTEQALHAVGVVAAAGESYRVSCNSCPFADSGPWSAVKRHAAGHEAGSPDHYVTVWGPGTDEQMPRAMWAAVAS